MKKRGWGGAKGGVNRGGKREEGARGIVGSGRKVGKRSGGFGGR